MNHITLLAIIAVAILIVLSTGFEYWQSRNKGLSHDDSVHDATVAGGFLSGSALIGYVITMIT